MAWVIDASVVVDLVTGDPAFEPASSACLQAHLGEGLSISPGPSFFGDALAAETFLQAAGISTSEFWNPADSLLSHRLWHQHQLRRRQLKAVKRPVADVLIAAFAQRFQGLITRKAPDFRNILPTLTHVEP